jgi:hypothetical protein
LLAQLLTEFLTLALVQLSPGRILSATLGTTGPPLRDIFALRLQSCAQGRTALLRIQLIVFERSLTGVGVGR